MLSQSLQKSFIIDCGEAYLFDFNGWEVALLSGIGGNYNLKEYIVQKMMAKFILLNYYSIMYLAKKIDFTLKRGTVNSETLLISY